MSNAQTTAQGLAPLSEPVSPELVLVDPRLASQARVRLPDRPEFPPPRPPEPRELAVVSAGVAASGVPTPAAAPVESVPRPLPAPPPAATEPVRPRTTAWLPRAVGLALAVAVGIGLAFDLVPSRDSRPVLQDAGGEALPAGPSRSDAAAAAPPPAEPAPPEAPQPAPAPDPPEISQTFVWPQAEGSAAYEFQLFREDTLVFRSRTTEPRLVLPDTWTHAGRAERLRPGSYRWYVWPVPRGEQKPSARALVQARLDVPGQDRPS